MAHIQHLNKQNTQQKGRLVRESEPPPKDGRATVGRLYDYSWPYEWQKADKITAQTRPKRGYDTSSNEQKRGPNTAMTQYDSADYGTRCSSVADDGTIRFSGLWHTV